MTKRCTTRVSRASIGVFFADRGSRPRAWVAHQSEEFLVTAQAELSAYLFQSSSFGAPGLSKYSYLNSHTKKQRFSEDEVSAWSHTARKQVSQDSHSRV